MAKAVANSPMGSFWQSLAYPITLSRLRPAQPVLAAGEKQDDSQYQQFFQFGQLGEVAGFAANSPRGILWTTAVIESFKQAPACPGGPSSILQFGVLLENGEFNILESLEVARPILQQGRHRI
ncbi:hypothetical protein BDZ97DRAFT_1926884 [Flammula alnicola]|nr:hypothetical protein BDZ97DRAFT_1926884 [Flammula alnicola]